MSTIKIKDADGNNRFISGVGAATLADPFFPINSDFFLEVSKGGVVGHSSFHRFGLNESTGNSFEDIWTVSTNLTYLTAASTLTVTSNNAQDDIAGTGAQKVSLVFLDGDFIEVTEVVDLNGNGAVITTGTALRLVSASVSQWGSAPGLNVALIGITATVGATTQGEIATSDNQTLMTHFTVPASKTAYMISSFVSVGKGDDAQVKLLIKDATITNAGFITAVSFPLFQNNFEPNSRLPKRFTEKTDLVIRGKAGAGNIAVGAGYDLVVINN